MAAIMKILLRQLMRIYLRNISAKFHPDPIWNDGALRVFEEVTPNKNNNKNKMSRDVRLVPGLKIESIVVSTYPVEKNIKKK